MSMPMPPAAIVAPPGFLSPAAFPFPNGPFGLPNDAPVPHPYFVGYVSKHVSTNTVTAQVQNPTNPGDAIVLALFWHTAFGSVTSCTDTQGNIYSLVNSNSGNPVDSVLVAQNTKPLTAADSVTITFSASNSNQLQVFIIGCSASLLSPQPGGEWVTFTAAGSSNQGSNAGTLAMTSSGVISGPAVIISMVHAFPVPPLLPQGWTVLSSGTIIGGSYGAVVAFKQTSSVFTPGSQVLAVQNPTPSTDIGGVYVVLQLETRYAAQPGLMPGAQSSPPGLMSPGAWPVMPQLPTTVNDAPLSPAPYPIGQGANSGAATVVLTVTTPTNPGDAIVVNAVGSTTTTIPISCTDSNGNAYSVLNEVASALSVQPAQFVSANPVPLAAGNTITVTFFNTASKLAAAIGVPGATLGSPTFPAYNLFNTTSSNGGSFALTTPTGAPFPAVPQVVVLLAANITGGPPQLSQGWTVIESQFNQSTSMYQLTAYQVTTKALAVGSAVASMLQINGNRAVLSYVTLQTETRFAPLNPHPDMPPGMQSPGAWQTQPGPFSPEGPWGTKYSSSPFLHHRTLPVVSVSHPAIVKATGKQIPAAPHPAGALVKGTSKSVTATPHPAGKLAKAAGKTLAAVTHPAGTLRKTAGIIRKATVHAAGTLSHGSPLILTATVHAAGKLARSTGKRLSASPHAQGKLVKATAKRLSAVAHGTAGLSHGHTLVLAAHVTAAARLIVRGPVRLFSAGFARTKWGAGRSRNNSS